MFKVIALELENQDPYQYLRAYSAGLQEFVEAMTFYQYLSSKTITSYTPIQEKLKYMITTSESVPQENDIGDQVEVINVDREITTLMPPSEFILGLADLTGELMRKCINNLSTGNVEGCFQTCDFVRNIYKAFIGLSNVQGYKEVGRKCYVLKQSLAKMELVCYNIVVRGSEIPKHMLATVVTQQSDHDSGGDDEGFY